MHKRPYLSASNLNGSDHLKVELIEPTGKPPFVAINWPNAATRLKCILLPPER